jgi:hypothetical protein
MGVENFIEIYLGFLQWHGTSEPYEQKIVEGELVLKNKSDEELSFINIRLENTIESSILSESKYYIPYLPQGKCRSIAFRLASLQQNYELKVTISFDTKSKGYVNNKFVVKIPGEKNIKHDSHLIFISYCTQDLNTIQFLVDRIKANQFRIWIAAHEIGEIDWFPDLIKSALEQANIFIIFLSKFSVESVWVLDELKIVLKQLKSGVIKQIIPVRIDDCQVPYNLIAYQPINFMGNEEELIKEIVKRLNKFIS